MECEKDQGEFFVQKSLFFYEMLVYCLFEEKLLRKFEGLFKVVLWVVGKEWNFN